MAKDGRNSVDAKKLFPIEIKNFMCEERKSERNDFDASSIHYMKRSKLFINCKKKTRRELFNQEIQEKSVQPTFECFLIEI